jgi:hypothetical protein
MRLQFGAFATSLAAILIACSGETGSGGAGAGQAGGGSGGLGGQGASGGQGGSAGGFTGCIDSGDCDGGVCLDGVCCPTQAQACGNVCCDAAQVCLFEKCVAPGDDCTTAADCQPGEYCETALGENSGGQGGAGGGCSEPLPVAGKCLEAPAACDENGQPEGCLPACEYFPPVGQLSAELKYQWGSSLVAPEHLDVWSTPTVGRLYDANCDGAVDVLDPPNILFVSGRAIEANTGLGTCCQCTNGAVSACKSGVLRLLNGRTGAELWSVEKPSETSIGFSGVSTALGDIDADGRMDIVAVTGEGYIVLLDDQGVVKRTSNLPLTQVSHGTFGWGGGLAVADMDGDGFPEIAYGATVFRTTDNAITLAWTGANGIGGRQFDALSTFVDLDGAPDGQLELLAGKSAYRADGTTLWNRTDLAEGYPGIGDFNADGVPEVVHVAGGSLWILNAATGATLVGPLALPGTGSGGPPTVADFDGDGMPEIGVAKATFYSVVEVDLQAGLSVLWQTPNHDLSSSVTGSSVFDFEGDGRAEVIYADECFLWVFDGQTGAVRFATSTTSFTATEASLVADVDGNGHSELVMVSNGADPSAAGWGCKDAAGMPTVVNGVAWTPSPTAAQSYRGLSVFGDTANSWVGTRTLWNQHSYHVSNICDDRDNACEAPNVYGSIPQQETSNWTLPWLNNFRQNVQDQGIFNAPDAVLSLAIPCETPLTAEVSVRNQGLASLPAGVIIRVYKVLGDVLVGQGATSGSLFPGQTQVLSIEVDSALASSGDTFVARIFLDPANITFHECREDNNESAQVTPPCAE